MVYMMLVQQEPTYVLTPSAYTKEGEMDLVNWFVKQVIQLASKEGYDLGQVDQT